MDDDSAREGRRPTAEAPGPTAGAAERAAGLRDITDVRTLRALTHPVRIAIIEALTLHGPMTATQVGERIGESPTTCSFHLRQLAKYNFVEEAGGGRGRARPWRMTAVAMNIAARDDPEWEMASTALLRLFRDRQLERYRAWLETKAMFPLQWRKAAGEGDYLFYLTAAELDVLNDELCDFLMSRFPERLTDPARRPADAVPVEMLVFSYPVMPPADDQR